MKLEPEDIVYWAMYDAEFEELQEVAKTVYQVYKKQRKEKYPELHMEQQDWHKALKVIQQEKIDRAKKEKRKKKQQAKRERALLNKWGVK
jgi:hypothetical protein